MSMISLVKQKGGCGASTLAVNLSGEFAARGRRVVLLDADAVWAGFAALADAVETLFS
jgi:chromosome partitioning protein